jgi:hypothetical protein
MTSPTLPRRAFRAAALLAAASAVIGSARAEEFRIESKVYVADKAVPTSENTTFFRAGIVYDFLTQPAEITIFDKGRGRFILLDTTRRIRTEIKTDQVLEFSQRLQARATDRKDPFLNFLATPKFDEQFDQASGELSFTSSWMTYRLTMSPAKSEEASQQYRDFSDWYARLNCLTNPASLPPFARMAVNEALSRRQEIPKTVRLTISRKPLQPKSPSLRSEHEVTWRLSDSDLARIDRAGKYLVAFPPVSFDEFRRKASQEARR